MENCERHVGMAMQANAWMTSELFHAWIQHFIKNVKDLGGISKTERHLLIVDSHTSHVTLEVALTAKEEGINILTLPSHTSHGMQPLDVNVFGPFKTYF